ncbi:MAG: orotidine-5'-phosphate decarboxylase [Bacteroidetes bacterium]|nr:orotidine-5'-phosphate decarboxylase [Bacteroidota bacterium]
MNLDFFERLRNAQIATNSLVCVGLDPDLEKIPDFLGKQYKSPEAIVTAFNRAIIQATAPYACAYKLNSAFYESMGGSGFDVLKTTLESIPKDKIRIIDAKRGDIGNTASKYAYSIFNLLDADGCTVAPYMGLDAVEPFLAYEGRAVFILVRTSNPSSHQLQSLMADGHSLYEHVARLAFTWGENLPGSVGFVVGATNPAELTHLREEYPDTPFLIPGIGAQGGSIATVGNVAHSKGLVLVNSSRGILYASAGENFDKMAAKAAMELRNILNKAIHDHAD